MKENKGKGPAYEETMLETQSQPRPVTGDKRKTLSKKIDLGDLPSCRGHKKAKHGSSKSRVVKPSSIVPPASSQQPSIQILDLDSSILTGGTSSQPPRRAPMNRL